MNYYLLEQIRDVHPNGELVSKCDSGAVVFKTSKLSELSDIDFIHKGCLMSDRLKCLFEKYMPKSKWVMNTYIDLDSTQSLLDKANFASTINDIEKSKNKNGGFDKKKPGSSNSGYDKIQTDLESAQLTFWALNAYEFTPSEKTVFKGNGLVQSLHFRNEPPEPIFKINAPGNHLTKTNSIIVHISVAESILARDYFGVKPICVTDSQYCINSG